MYDLMGLLHANQNTAFGKRYGFSAISSVRDFQESVPILSYEDYLPYIERIADGEEGVLTEEKVLLFEPSSGSTSATKLIPYTKSLQEEFLSGLTPWLEDLQANFDGIFAGQVYFSITPQTHQNRTTKAGLAIGFESDSDYLGDFGKTLEFIVPPRWEDTLDCLLAARDLRFISIWNPTLFLLLIESLDEPQRYFPNLRVISCWADGNAKPYAEKLQKLFPGVRIQPKGLLATEGIITIPIEGMGKRLCESHFFEFLDDGGKAHLSDDLSEGKSYDVVLTTGGGLYRYKLGDLVRYNGDGCFDFVGKSANISDYFGEKLNESHVAQVIGNGSFRLLVPGEGGYILYSETPADPKQIDAGLRENYHYDYCRRLGQLKEVAVVVVKNGERQYLENQVRFGMRLGDIKPQCLSNKKGWIFR